MRQTNSHALIFWKLWFAHYFTVLTFVLYLLSTVVFNMNSYVMTAYKRHLRRFLVTALLLHVGNSLAVDSFVTLSLYTIGLGEDVSWSWWSIRPVADALFATIVATVSSLACYSRRTTIDVDFENKVVGSLLTSLLLAYTSLTPFEMSHLETQYGLMLLATRALNVLVVVANFTKILGYSKSRWTFNETLYNNIVFTNGIITIATRDLMLCNQ